MAHRHRWGWNHIWVPGRRLRKKSWNLSSQFLQPWSYTSASGFLNSVLVGHLNRQVFLQLWWDWVYQLWTLWACICGGWARPESELPPQLWQRSGTWPQWICARAHMTTTTWELPGPIVNIFIVKVGLTAVPTVYTLSPQQARRIQQSTLIGELCQRRNTQCFPPSGSALIPPALHFRWETQLSNWSAGLYSNNMRANPTPDRAMTTTEQRGVYNLYPGQALVTTIPVKPSIKKIMASKYTEERGGSHNK